MTSKPVALLLADLGVTQSHSRPRVSNDNPYSEAQFKTLKYRPGFPARFASIQAARVHCQDFFPWYNNEHRHGGLCLHTAADVHYGRAAAVQAGRAQVLDAACHAACRNLGTAAVVAHALSAVDIALWDLKARLLGVPLTRLFGGVRPATPVYGSGGFTTLTDDELGEQIDGWLAAGCRCVKIKIGEDRGERTERDLERVSFATGLLGDRARLMVDANGAYSAALARRVGADLDRHRVIWFEEPVTSDDPPGLALLRATLRCDVTAGEYVYRHYDAAALIGSVDCLQLDVTRCGGYSGFLECAALAAAHGLDISAHCAPSLHAPIVSSFAHLRHVEWFIDHARLEPLLVDGVPEVRDGVLATGRGTGHGMRLADSAGKFSVGGADRQ